MSRVLHWLSPGDPNQRTGGYLYNARVVEGIRHLGWDITVHTLPGDWPSPSPADIRECETRLRHIPPAQCVLADGLAWPGLGAVGLGLASQNPVVVLVHSLLDRETGNARPEDAEQEAAALAAARGWIATSDRTAGILRSRIRDAQPGRVIVPGCDPAPAARGRGGRGLLCVATVTPRKGQRVLLAALAGLPHLDWELVIAGSLDRNPAYVDRVRSDIASLGLQDRVQLMGELDDPGLVTVYDHADLLVHTAHFEAYGMAITEALTRGIPVVSTPAGALDSISSDAATVVPAGNVEGFRQAVEGLLVDPSRRKAMARAARAIPFASWHTTSMAFAAALEALL